MIKRLIVFMLTVCMLFGMLPEQSKQAYAESLLFETENTVRTVEELGYDRETLTVATFTPLTGCFFTDMWGNGTSDIDVKKLLHGYPLTRFDMETLNFVKNDEAVLGLQITKDKKGNREYNIFLWDDLYYSDGSRITAYDYAFSVLFQLSPETEKAGADRPNFDYIMGAEEYASGESKVISGIHVVSDTQLKITIDKNAFPYYYELSYIDFMPYPISAIAPSCRVADDGEGIYIDGDFNSETLLETVFNEETGYMTKPQIVSGPYTLVSYDGTTAVFSLNTYHKGSGKAAFKTVKYTSVPNEKAAEALASGSTAIVHKAMNAETIVPLNELLRNGNFSMSAYSRTGLSFISFCCERPGMDDEQVRKAIAMCLDKEALTKSVVGGYGTVIDGYYGIGQWMYRVVSGTADYPTDNAAQLKKWEALGLEGIKTYAFDPVAAGEMLESAGWKMNEQGIREKQINNETVELRLTLVVGESSGAAEFLKKDFTEALMTAGILLDVKTLPWPELLKLYYREQERSCDMFYLASNFEDDFNPASWFSTEERAQGIANKTGILDKALSEKAADLVKTASSDTFGYCVKWIDFLEEMSERMPVIPIFSNIYFDYYTAALTNYNPSMQLSWADTIYELSLQDVATDIG